jgi:hypothetical protein
VDEATGREMGEDAPSTKCGVSGWDGYTMDRFLQAKTAESAGSLMALGKKFSDRPKKPNYQGMRMIRVRKSVSLLVISGWATGCLSPVDPGGRA